MAEQLQQFQGRLVGMQQQALGSTLTVGAAIGATVLTVAETGDFNEDGGFLITPAGAVYEYVAVGDTASTVTLAGAGLTVALAAEDAVHLYDDELESEVVEYVGQVLLDDQDPGDEPIEVTVQHSLVNLIAETIRGGAAEAVTLVRDGDDDLMIWQVDGKVVSDVALAEVKTDLSADIQAAYDLADSKATEAYVNATATTISQTAANGKSKVTYSLSAPGTTANNAGDIWFQKELTTQTVIGQWQGLGGNSWQQVTLNDQVIANLDAGKLVAGSAFINGLWIKTNFTLGDASTNGVIQSYNFASSPVGVFIDKTGLVAKGGQITGATVTGATVTGGTVQTNSGASSGAKMIATGLPNAGFAAFNGTSRTFWVRDDTGGLECKSIFVEAGGSFESDAGADIYNGLYVGSGGADVSGNSHFWNAVAIDGAATFNGDVSGFNSIGTITAAGLTTGGAVHAGDVYVDGHPTTTNAANCYMNPSTGRLLVNTSTRRNKKDIRAADIDVAKVYEVEPKFYRSRLDADDPDQVFPGFIAEDLADLGLEEFIGRDGDGLPASVAYGVWPVAQQAAIRDLNRRIAVQQEQINDLTERLARLEQGA